jgi:glycosyltransferase involved in cell wall biosynthesis
MTRPFFSIIIPTKNRSFVVGYAIRSVLNQSFANYEIMLVDNDDTDATRQVVDGFTDCRIHYFRTGNLSMPDNWEFGVSQARGEYLMILEDKQALKRHALLKLFSVLQQQDVSVATWLFDGFHSNEEPPFVNRIIGSGRVLLFPVDQVLQYIVSEHFTARQLPIPRAINSCVHRTIVEKIRSGPMGRLCAPVSPDYTMAFLTLAYTDAVLHIDESLAVYETLQDSNGCQFIMKSSPARQFIREVGGESVFYDLVPIKALYIPINTAYNDYCRVRAIVGGNLTRFPLNLAKYFAFCYGEIQANKQMFDIDFSPEEQAFETALAQQSDSVKIAFRNVLLAPKLSLPPSTFKRIYGSFGNILEYVECEE